MRKSFKTLSELKFEFVPKTWKVEALAHTTPLEGCSLKIEIVTRLLFFLI